MQVNIHHAKTYLSELLTQVGNGEEVIIARSGHPIARLVPFAVKAGVNRRPGSARNRVKISKDFNDPLPQEILDQFYK